MLEAVAILRGLFGETPTSFEGRFYTIAAFDGQIGRERYQSVAGSLHAFQRFAAALRDALVAAGAR